MTDDDELRALALGAANVRACSVCHEEFLAACDPQTILSLLDRLQAAERDAARYRWLRDGQNPSVGLHRADVIYMQHKHGAELDAAIDAAQGAQDTPGDA